jgi:hypothetical protein
MTGPTTSIAPIVPIAPIAPVPGDGGAAGGYVPGACNIGPWEIRRRRVAALVGFGITTVTFVLLVVVGAPAWTRLLLILPLGGSLVAWLQARRRFCVQYGLRGVWNFGDDEGTLRTVEDPAQRAADRRRVVELVRDGFLLAIVPTLVAVLLPL